MEDLRFPGYRIAAHHRGNTQAWPVPADRILEALTNRIGVLGDVDEEEARSEAELLLRRLDNGGGELEADVGERGARLWLTGLDPAVRADRDTLGAIGVTNLTWPV